MTHTPIPVIERIAPSPDAIRAAIRRILEIEDERRLALAERTEGEAA